MDKSEQRDRPSREDLFQAAAPFSYLVVENLLTSCVFITSE
jgi:hypothetical protein